MANLFKTNKQNLVQHLKVIFLAYVTSWCRSGNSPVWLSSKQWLRAPCRFHPALSPARSLSLFDVWEKGGGVANSTIEAVPRRKPVPLNLYIVCMLSRSVVSHPLQPFGLWPTGILWPWDFPGRNIGVGCHSLLQDIFPTQGLIPHLLHLLHWQNWCFWNFGVGEDSWESLGLEEDPASPS